MDGSVVGDRLRQRQLRQAGCVSADCAPVGCVPAGYVSAGCVPASPEETRDRVQWPAPASDGSRATAPASCAPRAPHGEAATRPTS